VSKFVVVRAAVVVIAVTCCSARVATAQQPKPQEAVGATDAPAAADTSKAAPTAAATPTTPTPTTVPATTQSAAAGVVVDDGPAYPVSAFEVKYKLENPSLPDVSALMAQPIKLGVLNNAYVVPPSLERKWVQLQPGAERIPPGYRGRDIPTRTVTLAELGNDAVDQFHVSAIWAINEQLKTFLNNRGVIGVYIVQDFADIDTSGIDRRQEKKTLGLVIYTGVVRQVRTVGSGDRVSETNRINNPMHKRILADSPVKPESTGGQAGMDLLRRDSLDRYVYSLNRHPGRRVDVAVSAFSDEPGEVILDYLVTEAKPWLVYSQISNTGTKDTSEWRERFGFVHNQLTNNDDILTLDYTTAGFTESHAVQASYEAPLMGSRRWRWRVFGMYSEFTASDVGQARENFQGQQYELGGELIVNVYQKRDFFVDLFGGAKYERVRVDNRDVDITGDAGFVVPYVGLRAQRLADVSSTFAELTLSGRFTGASQTDLDALGRFNADKNAAVLQFQFVQSIFLEPLLFPQAFKEARTTLAHEVVLSARAQTSFGSRLIPQAEDVIGGLYSVRGYDESVAAGDDVILGSVEYRWHVPRSLEPREPKERPKDPKDATRKQEQPFKWAPQQAYGRPDWDLILRTFLDAGQTYNADKLGFENDETLVGIGIGAELQVKQNLALRVDWGFPLTELDGQKTDDSRVHISATFMW
jgi:hemolysin activation/secretion protein